MTLEEQIEKIKKENKDNEAGNSLVTMVQIISQYYAIEVCSKILDILIAIEMSNLKTEEKIRQLKKFKQMFIDAMQAEEKVN